MNNYKPYAYLYKDNTGDPETLKSCFITQIPVGKKLVLHSGDPSTDGDTTTIRYTIVADATKDRIRMEEFENEFDWDGNSHFVKVTIGSGSGADGGESITGSDYAELF